MLLLFTVIGAWFLVIAGVEFAIWKLLRRKIEGILLPHDADASSLQFFTLQRLRLCTVAHTLFLWVCVGILFPLTW